MPRIPRLLLVFAAFVSGARGLAQAGEERPFGLQKFVDPLPDLPRLRVAGPCPCELTLSAAEFTTSLHRDLAPLATWGYEGSSPGPVIEVERGHKLTVHWVNKLPARHLFPLPAGLMPMAPDVRMVTHLHGAVVAEPDPLNQGHNSDGWPDAFGGADAEQVAEYPNRQSARMLWYHDHAMGTTGRNVAAGLAGIYEIHDRYERSLHLPSGAFEVPVVLQSRQLTNGGALAYTKNIANEFYGNVVAVNGKLWPFLRVEPRKYRLRIINIANARTFALSLLDAADHSPGPAFSQIGGDGGFLPEVAVLNDPTQANPEALVLAPAERADVVVDFASYAGHDFVLRNSDKGTGDREYPIPELMLFRVGQTLSQPDHSRLPRQLRPIAKLDPSHARQTRQVVFDQMAMADGSTMLTLNGKTWTDPLSERPVLGTTEVWNLVNLLPDVHPFHIHLTNFQVLDRTPFDAVAFKASGGLVLTGPPQAALPNERGWKDTVQVLPGMVTRIIMKFAPYTGFYVYHCHILEHEDMDMMRPFEVINPWLKRNANEVF